MKTIAIGDIHGRTIWKDIVSKELKNSDKIIFIGDYFDTHDKECDGNQQAENFSDILQFKRDNFDKVILLFGNHDFHYINTMAEVYSGFQPAFASMFRELIGTAIKENLIQLCYKQDDFVFSHAGISKVFIENLLQTSVVSDKVIQSLNDYLKYQPNLLGFTPGPNYDNYGDDVTQTPIWIRPRSLMRSWQRDKEKPIQVVGHTTMNHLDIKGAATGGKFYFIDTLGTSGEYLILTDNVVSVGQIAK